MAHVLAAAGYFRSVSAVSVLSFPVLMALAVVVTGTHLPGYCEFPEYLYRPHHLTTPDNLRRLWLSKTGYVNNTEKWTKQLEITAKRREIIVRTVEKTQCVNPRSNHTRACVKKEVLHHWICLSEEPEGKYRVQVKRPGDKKPQFACLKFHERNRNLVQIWQATPKAINEGVLCYSESLQRDPWPWISIAKEEWSFCPISGGYDFRAHVSGGPRYCHRFSRPSRLESECVMGEGTQFLFPLEKCSFFQRPAFETRLYCWASWVEQEHLFIVLGDDSSHPQYTLRMPKDRKDYKQFSAYFYFSVVAPMRGRGRPPGGVMFVEMRMSWSGRGKKEIPPCYDEGDNCEQISQEGECASSNGNYCKKTCGLCEKPTCYDESDECAKLDQEGRCATSDGNYCKKTCGLCGESMRQRSMKTNKPMKPYSCHSGDLAPSIEPECGFPRGHSGDWVWFESSRRQDVTINSGRIFFSDLGTFACKSKHWAVNQYKLFSYYDNGCRPRYSCMHLKKGNDKTLLFKLSRSSLADHSFDICMFEDDPTPLGGTIRSSETKAMYASSELQKNVCGLSASVSVNATFRDDVSCSGTLSDWRNNHKCEPKSELSLSLYECSHNPWQDFICTAYVPMDDSYSILITESIGSHKRYTCWIIERYGNLSTLYPWKSAHRLDTAQCGAEKKLEAIKSNTLMTVQVKPDSVVRGCGSRRITVNPDLASSSTNQPHAPFRAGTDGPDTPYNVIPANDGNKSRPARGDSNPQTNPVKSAASSAHAVGPTANVRLFALTVLVGCRKLVTRFVFS